MPSGARLALTAAEAQILLNDKNRSLTDPRGRSGPLPYERVAVVGGGAWGTALAITADAAGRGVSLWVREADAVAAIARSRRNPFLPRIPLPDRIRATDKLAEALSGAALAILAVPSQHLRSIARQAEPLLPLQAPVVICSKGVEAGSGALMTQVVAEEMPGRLHAVLSGPSFAEEVATGQPTAVTIAAATAGEDSGLDNGVAARVAVTLGSPSFRPYLSDDPVGAEVGGAVKNVLAIACGIAAGCGLGANPRAALITRGLAEIKRLAEALGGRPETVAGLAGIGDLTLTCSSEQSRNFSFGKALGEGRRAADALAGNAVVEGAANARSVAALAARLGIEMPICAAVDAIVHDGLPIAQAMRDLLMRPLRAEPRELEHAVRLRHPAAEDAFRSPQPA